MVSTTPLEAFVCREVLESYFFPNSEFSEKRHFIITLSLVFAAMLGKSPPPLPSPLPPGLTIDSCSRDGRPRSDPRARRWLLRHRPSVHLPLPLLPPTRRASEERNVGPESNRRDFVRYVWSRGDGVEHCAERQEGTQRERGRGRREVAYAYGHLQHFIPFASMPVPESASSLRGIVRTARDVEAGGTSINRPLLVLEREIRAPGP